MYASVQKVPRYFQDDYFWKRCFKNWPSVGKRKLPPALSYYKLFQTKRPYHKTILPPRLSFSDLEFYIDIWSEGKLIFSDVVPGPAFQKGTGNRRIHFIRHAYKMILPMEPRFAVTFCPIDRVSVSVIVGHKDTRKVACIIERSTSCIIPCGVKGAGLKNMNILTCLHLLVLLVLELV